MAMSIASFTDLLLRRFVPRTTDKRLITKTSAMWGELHLQNERPKIHVVENSIYVPQADDKKWGIFDEKGHIIESSVNFSGPNRETPEHDISDIDPLQYQSTNYNGTFIYVGNLSVHFGHFLIETLPRLWFANLDEYKDLPILCHFSSGVDIAWGLAPSFISEIFGALGIKDRVHKFDVGGSVQRLLIPESTMQAQYDIHQFLRDAALRVTSKLGLDLNSPARNSTPLYISKSRLAIGVTGFEDEAIFEHVAQKRGVEIYHPQEHTFSEQIRELSSRRYIVGTVGSAFHSLVFCPGPRTVVALNGNRWINSNYMLIDKVASVDAHYFYPQSDLVSYGRTDRFLRGYRLTKAEAVAEEFFAKASRIRWQRSFFGVKNWL